MNLQNGYKVLYAETADGIRTYKASKTGIFANAEQIGDAFEIGKYKLVYVKDGQIYGSESNIPTDADTCFEAFDAIFTETDSATETGTTVEPKEPEQPVEEGDKTPVKEDEEPEEPELEEKDLVEEE